MRWLVPISMIMLLVGCASGTATQRPVNYQSGTAPTAFDLEASMRSPGNYEVNGASYSFAELSQLITRQNAASVMVRGTKTVGDVICLAMLGIKSNSKVFYDGSDGTPRSVTWNGDADDTAGVMQSCEK